MADSGESARRYRAGSCRAFFILGGAVPGHGKKFTDCDGVCKMIPGWPLLDEFFCRDGSTRREGQEREAT